MSLEVGIWASRLGFEPQGWDLRIQARIWALRLEFGPRDYVLGLKTRILAPRPGNELQRGWTEKEKEEKKEKLPLCVKAKVIGSYGAAAQKGRYCSQ